jgi:drug/metabolite transporter (DMT)-like permease
MVTAMSLSGTIGLFVLASGQPALTVVFFRCLIGGLALLGWLVWTGGWQRLDRRATGWLLVGGAALILNWICLFSAYRMSSISVATVVYHVQPFFLILLAALVQKERPAWHRLVWLALALIGVGLTAGLDPRGGHGSMLAGVALALLAALLYAVATLATRKLSSVPAAQIAGAQLMLGVTVLAPFADFSTIWQGWHAWSSLLVLGLVHTGLMYNLMYAAFQRLSAGMIASLSFIYPLVAIVADVAVFHTALGAAQLAGILLILLAVVANQRGWDFTALRAYPFAPSRSQR